MRIALLIVVPMALAAAAQTNAAAPPSVEVHLSNYRFTPSGIRLTHGHSYMMRFVNDAGGAHNFIAKQFFAAAGMDSRSRALVAKGGVEVPGDGTVEIKLVAPAPGHYRVRCTHFLHAGFGMKDEIVVD